MKRRKIENVKISEAKNTSLKTESNDKSSFLFEKVFIESKNYFTSEIVVDDVKEVLWQKANP